MGIMDAQLEALRRCQPIRVTGRVEALRGLMIVANNLPASNGATCHVRTRAGQILPAEVVGFESGKTLLMALGSLEGIAKNDIVSAHQQAQQVGVGDALLGRVINGMGQPIDGKGDIGRSSYYPLLAPVPDALTRRRIDAPLATGVRTIDSLLTVGLGQRVGIFAGTGVGKSVALGMIARYTSADVVVVGLVGERGREVREFLERDLGERGLAKSVVVVSTSDQPPVVRVRAGFVATAVAEYYRDQGLDVLLLMDSVTRLAMAQRQIGLAAGEPPATKGYTPSVFSLLAGLLERSGQSDRGSITGIYSVLVEGDDLDEPIADAVRGILDGHIWLDRKLADRGHYPAICALSSISRVMPDVVDREHQYSAMFIKRLLASYREIEDMVKIGAYTPGGDLELDLAVNMKPRIDAFFQQRVDEALTFAEARAGLMTLIAEANSLRENLGKQAGHSAAQPTRKAVA